MRDEDRTKDELIEELRELRSRVKACEQVGDAHKRLEVAGVNCDILLNNVGDLAYVCDDKGNILYVNRAFERLSGHAPGEFIGRSFAPLFSDKDLEVATDNYKRTLAGESPSYEIAFKDTGTLCSYRNVPFRDADGRIIGVLGIARDVTEERRAETDLVGMRQRLIDSEERYRTLIEQSPDNIIIHSLDGTILFTNSSRIDVLGGKTPEDIIGKNAMQFVHPDDRDYVLSVVGKLLEDYEAGRFCVQNIEHRFVRLDGSVFQGEATGCPFVYKGELAMQVIVRDVTERKEAERALSDSRRRYRSLFENMLVGAAYHKVIYDDNGDPADIVFLEINKAYEKSTGIKREDVIGKRATEIFPGLRDKKPDLVEIYGRVATTGNEATLEFYFEPLGRWYNVSAYSPEKGFFVATFSDITERKVVEDELRRSRDELEEKVTERTAELERLNAVLRESESLYRSLVNTIPYGIQENDNEGMITFTNPAYDLMNGCGPGGVLGKYIWDMLAYEDDRDSLKAYFKKLVAEQPTPVPFYGVNLTADGRKMDAKVDWHYKRNSAGELTGFISVITDITEQKRAEEEIKRNYQVQRVMSSIMRNSLRPAPLKGVLEYALGAIVSAPFFSMMNMGSIFLSREDGTLVLTAHRGLPEPLLKVCSTVPLGECLCGRAAETRKPVYLAKVDSNHTYRYAGIKPHGHYCVPILLGERVLGVINTYLPHGHAESQDEVEFLSMIADTLAGIIERKRAEEDLRLQSEMVSNMTEGAALVRTNDAVIVHTNPRFEEMFGYAPGELTGKNVSVLNAPVSDSLSPDEVRAKIVDVLNRDGTWSGEILNVRKDGTSFWGRATVTTFTSEQHGEVWLAVHEDIAAQKEAEEERERLEDQLVQSQKMEAIGTLAGGVAHDFNNIMTVIKNLTTLALGKIGENHENLRECLEPVCEVSERAADLVQQLLVFSQSKPLVSEPLDINETIDGLLVMLKSLVREDITLETRFSDNLMEVKGDRSRIEQVITNLIVNSRDAMPKGGSIAIATDNVHFDEKSRGLGEGAWPGDYVRVVVRDTGTGMTPEVAEHIFEPFFTTKSPQGTGLGLSVVYGIVREIGGWIEVETRVGAGTRIAVYLPAVEGPVEAAGEVPLERMVNHGDGRRILLVEDDKWVRRSTAMVLEENGYTVVEAENAEDAIRLFYREKGKFDLILSDVVMPGRSGLQMLSPILDLTPRMPVLLFSGHLDDKVELAEIIRRGIAYIHKPFEISELLCAVEDTIETGRGDR